MGNKAKKGPDSTAQDTAGEEEKLREQTVKKQHVS